MEKPRTVTFKECELIKEGTSAKGVPWVQYQYFGNDGEHYTLFGKHDLEKPYTLIQETTVSKKDGKTYTNWVIAKEGKAGGGGNGLRTIMDKLEAMTAQLQQIEGLVTDIAENKTKRGVSDVDLTF